MELNSVILAIGSSVGFFKLVNYGIGKLPIPETAQRNAWKWKNISTSFVHSLITGVWSVLWWVTEFPHMFMGNTHPYIPVCTVCWCLYQMFENFIQEQIFSAATHLMFNRHLAIHIDMCFISLVNMDVVHYYPTSFTSVVHFHLNAMHWL